MDRSDARRARGDRTPPNYELVPTAHDYRIQNLSGIKFCDNCRGFLWGLWKQGQVCRACRRIVCHMCASRAIYGPPCPGTPIDGSSSCCNKCCTPEVLHIIEEENQEADALKLHQRQLDRITSPREQLAEAARLAKQRAKSTIKAGNRQHLNHSALRRESTGSTMNESGLSIGLEPSNQSRKAFLLYASKVQWLRANYLWGLYYAGDILTSLQETPQTAFLSKDELRAELSKEEPALFVVSHPWLSEDHPDPCGIHLEALVELGGPNGGALPVEAAVFWDFASLPQRPRTRSQEATFQEALDGMELLFVASFTCVVRLEHVPADSQRAIAYKDRGWCMLEHKISAQKGPRTYAIIDPGDGGKKRRGTAVGSLVPCPPKMFEEQLHEMTFSTQGDRAVVARLYERAFTGYISHQTTLQFQNLQKDDLFYLIECVPHFRELRMLTLTECSVNTEHLQKLSGALAGLSKLQEIQIKQGAPFDNTAAGILDGLRRRGVKIGMQHDDYVGEWQNGIPFGRGRCVYADGETYEGEWKAGLEHGAGRHTYVDGEVYDGQFENAQRHGVGTFTYADGAVYEGRWVADQKQGHGRLTFVDGASYEGDFEAGHAKGQGMYTFPDGRAYDGQWSGGHMHGYGVFTFPDGEAYDGEWHTDLMHGCGKFLFSDGTIYQGEYEGGLHHGLGKYAYPDGSSYQGNFRTGQMHGHGKYCYADGGTYEGEFAADLHHGRGKYTFASGDVYEGEWANHQQHGDGRYTLANGRTILGEWRKGEIVSR